MSLLSALRTLALRALLAAACLGVLSPASAQDGGAAKYNGKIERIDAEKGILTVKAVMGHKDLRLATPALLEKLKVGDQVRLTLGPNGTETVVTSVEVIR
jgi:Cu/Ag efflux protein CusF